MYVECRKALNPREGQIHLCWVADLIDIADIEEDDEPAYRAYVMDGLQVDHTVYHHFCDLFRKLKTLYTYPVNKIWTENMGCRIPKTIDLL